MKALCTGAHGFLGSYVVEELERRGWSVDAPTHHELDLVRGDEDQALMSRFARTSPDVVVHCAAAVGGIGANEAEPGRFFYDNAMMGIQLMEAARRWGVAKMLTVGTACMYPEWEGSPQREEHLWDGHPAPVTAPYAFAKRAVLEMGMAYRKQYDFNAVFVIPTNLYGPRDSFDLGSSHVIPGMIRRFSEAATDGEVTLWGTGYPTRDFLYVEDAARGIVDAVERLEFPDPVNLGTGVDVSIGQLAQTIAALTGFTGKIVWDRSKPDGTPYRRLSTERALGSLGWSAQTSLETGLEQTIDWYKANI
jgi:nucleoside-diphosphate-sugar epimerase